MSNLVIILFAFLLVIAMGFILFFVIKIQKIKGNALPKDSILAINFAPEYTEGYSVFQEIDSKRNSDGRTMSVLVPKDVPQNEAKTKKIPKVLHQVSAPGKRIAIPIGDLSSNRQIVFLLPPTPEQLPNSIKKTEFGKALLGLIDFKTIEEVTNDKVKKIRETVSKSAILGEETAFKHILELSEEMGKAIHNIYTKIDEKQRRSPTTGYQTFGS